MKAEHCKQATQEPPPRPSATLVNRNYERGSTGSLSKRQHPKYAFMHTLLLDQLVRQRHAGAATLGLAGQQAFIPP
jgi:hypothetical protein